MSEERTKLGWVTFIVLSAALVSVSLNVLISTIEYIVEVFSTAPESVPFISVLAFAGMAVLIFFLVAFIFFIYWNAFRNNEPQKIKGVTVVLLIVVSLIDLIAISFISVMKTADDGPTVKNPFKEYNIVQFEIGFLLWIAVFIILLVELRHKDSDRIKNIWIVVSIIALVNISTYFIGGSTTSSETAPNPFLTLLTGIFMNIGLALISCWITNSEKFFVTYEEDEDKKKGDNISSIIDDKPYTGNNYTSQLKELRHLLDEGFITEDDYNRKKNDILGFSDK